MRTTPAPDRLPGLLLLVALGLLALPVLSVRMPPLLDYPNHFARIWLLAGGAEAPPVSSFYAVDWANASTNMGIDVLAALLGAAVPAAVLAPLFLLAALILPPLGAAALNRAAFGGWHWWQVGFAALAWSATLLAGFLNFQIGIGLALLAAAAEPAVARLRPATAFAARVGLAAVVLPVHPFGVLFYAALLTGLALGPAWRPLLSPRGIARAGGRAAAAAGAAAVPLIATALLAPALPGAHTGEAAGMLWAPFTFSAKLDLLFSGIRTYRRGVDLALVGLLAAPAVWALARGRLRVHAGLLLAAAALLALALVVPWQIRGTSWIQERFPTMAMLALAAALRPEPVPGRRFAGAALAGALLAVSAARTAVVADVWIERQADVAAVERALNRLPPGAALLPMEHTPGSRDRGAPRGRFIRGQGNYWHLPALGVPWHQAFVPTLFAMKGKQPIRVLPPWDGIAVDDGGPVSVSALLAEDPTRYRSDWHKLPVHHLAHWRERFDYVLVLNADMPDGAGPARPVPGLELVADEGFAQLLRIQKQDGPPAAPAPGG
jgi:hypothetical protein